MKNISIIVKQRKKINTLENELESLKENLKNGLFNEFIKTAEKRINNEALKKENKKLRLKIKELKSKLKENEHGN